MQHKYQPPKPANDPILLSRFDGCCFTVTCSCGLVGAGETGSDAMEHLDRLHHRKKGCAPLLFVDVDAAIKNFEKTIEQ